MLSDMNPRASIYSSLFYPKAIQQIFFYKRGDFYFTFGASFRNGETAGLLLVENDLLNVCLFYLRKK
jgi:hypothetical protein